VLDIGSIVAFALAGEITRGIVVAVAAALPALLVGAAIGLRLRRRLDPQRFRRAVLVLLVVAAISAVGSAVVTWGDEPGDDDAASLVSVRTSPTTARVSWA
jgi:uncharacterized membrane protein YfcA